MDEGGIAREETAYRQSHLTRKYRLLVKRAIAICRSSSFPQKARGGERDVAKVETLKTKRDQSRGATSVDRREE